MKQKSNIHKLMFVFALLILPFAVVITEHEVLAEEDNTVIFESGHGTINSTTINSSVSSCDVEACKRFLCCKGDDCLGAFPEYCANCTNEICEKPEREPVCGNGICEEGEESYCPSCLNSNPTCGAPCSAGTCPQDCEKKCPQLGCDDISAKKGDLPQGCHLVRIKDEMGCPTCSTYPVCPPVCDKIGTSDEGWYSNGTLIKLDKCTCTPICSRVYESDRIPVPATKVPETSPGGAIGVPSTTVQEHSSITKSVKGNLDVKPAKAKPDYSSDNYPPKEPATFKTAYFNSCNGKLIEYADCIPEYETAISKTTVAKTISIEPSVSSGEIIVKSGKVSASTKENVLVDDKKLKVSTQEGKKEIYTPEQANDKAVAAGLSEVSSIVLKKDGDKVYYEVDGKKKSYFLWFIPFTKETSIKVDAQSNEIIK